MLVSILMMISLEMSSFCAMNGKKMDITSGVRTERENIRLGSRSVTHVEGRAIDISTRHWPTKFKRDFVKYFNAKYKHLGAFNGKRRIFILEHGYTNHLHIQVDKKFGSKNESYSYNLDWRVVPENI